MYNRSFAGLFQSSPSSSPYSHFHMVVKLCLGCCWHLPCTLDCLNSCRRLFEAHVLSQAEDSHMLPQMGMIESNLHKNTGNYSSKNHCDLHFETHSNECHVGTTSHLMIFTCLNILASFESFFAEQIGPCSPPVCRVWIVQSHHPLTEVCWTINDRFPCIISPLMSSFLGGISFHGQSWLSAGSQRAVQSLMTGCMLSQLHSNLYRCWQVLGMSVQATLCLALSCRFKL